MDTKHFIQTANPEPLIVQLVTTINNALSQGVPVAWLLSGGSAIPIAIAVAKQLVPGEPRQLLRILQIDERYGMVGHANSNWQQLLDAGFQCEGAQYRPVLHGLSFTLTIETYTETILDALGNCDLRIGLFGIGPDGHTAGMLPGSSAASEAKELVVGYPGPDFPRITITTPAIARLDLAVAWVGGEAKRATLKTLQGGAALTTQPAQAIKQAKNWFVYSDVLA
jgi:6-phosphogluconolactonase/glucosamine-6-phosphate isomerase/deaminase